MALTAQGDREIPEKQEAELEDENDDLEEDMAPDTAGSGA